MPPAPETPNTKIEPSHMPPHVQQSTSGAGPIVGMAIIIVLLVFGALYFWGAHLNKESQSDALPLIPSGTSTNSY